MIITDRQNAKPHLETADVRVSESLLQGALVLPDALFFHAESLSSARMPGVPPDPRHDCHMTAQRSRRLEALLGADLDAARYAHFRSLVQAQVSESFDLDFKREHYGSADRDKLALAGDVAAIASSAGGIIVLGIEEDAHARAVAAPGVTISDGEIRRIHQIIADRVAPVPVLGAGLEYGGRTWLSLTRARTHFEEQIPDGAS